jgi:imidazole glycerol-phosphate synthase subunit HisH
MIGIIDYGSGNVGAIANIYKQLKVPHVITSSIDSINAAERYILPGVGHFDTTMDYIRQSGLHEVLHENIIVQQKKVLGICVGMQILADSSEEGSRAGLGWIPGRVKRIDEAALNRKPKLPHMGWNSIKHIGSSRLLQGVDLDRGFYFLHSYYFATSDVENVKATVTYGHDMTCGVERNNVFGFQFHPEKSHSNGMTVFHNFARL